MGAGGHWWPYKSGEWWKGRPAVVAGGGGDAVSQGRRLVIRWARDQAGEIRSEVISDGCGGAEGGAEAGGGRERWGCSAAGIG